MEALLEKIRVADQVTWRRWLHQHAELSFEEFETTAYIENLLRDVPISMPCQWTNWLMCLISQLTLV